MSSFSNLIGGGSSINKLISDSRDSGNLFRDASWSQVGTNKDLTDFLHSSLDPNGDKYGGDTEALKTDLLNTTTARGSSAVMSIWDAVGARSEGQQKKQFENLVGRLYEDAPNRLVSGDADQTYQAIKSGMIGALGYDIGLNLLFGAGVLGKLVGGGAKALEAAGARTLATRAAEATVGDMAMDQAGGAIVKDLTKAGAWQGAKTEALGGAASGLLGDLGQQDAAVSRGLQDERSFTSALANTAGGALLGGAFGAVGGAVEGRSLGKKMAGGLEEAVSANRTAIGDNIVDELNIGKPDLPDGTEAGFVSLDDTYAEFKVSLDNASDGLGEFANRVRMQGDNADPRFTPENIDTLKSALVELSDGNRMSEGYKAQANAYRSQADATGNPELLKLAAQTEAEARRYDAFVQQVLTGKDNLGSGALDEADINSLVNMVSRFSPEVAEAFGKPPVETATAATGKAGKAPKAPKATEPTQPLVQAATEPPAAATTVTTADGTIIKTEAPAADAAPIKSNILNETPEALKARVAAEDVATDAAIKAEAEAKFAPIRAKLDAALESGDIPAARAAQVEYQNAIAENLNTVAEKTKAAAAAKVAAAKAAPPAATVTPAAPAAVADTAPASLEIKTAVEAMNPLEKRQLSQLNDALTKAGTTLDEAIAKMQTAGQTAVVSDVVKAAKAAGHTDVNAETVATNMASVTGVIQRERSKVAQAAPAAKTDLEKQLDETLAAVEDAAKQSAHTVYTASKAAMADQRTKVGTVLDNTLKAIDAHVASLGDGGKADGAFKRGMVDKFLDEAAKANPHLAAAIALLDRNKLGSAKGVAAAKASLKAAADKAVAWTYAKAVGDILPDAMNVEHYGTVLRSMLRGAPAEEVDNMVNFYKEMTYNALVDRIDAVGLDAVRKDARLGPALQRMMDDGSAGKRFGSSGAKFDLGPLIQRQAEMVVAKMGGAEITSKQITDVGGIVRDFMKQLQDSGIQMDSQFMSDAVNARIKTATEYVLGNEFANTNKEAFDKMAAMKELRDRDREDTVFARTNNMERNIFARGVNENPVLNRIVKDDGRVKDQIISGRIKGTDKPQGMLSDGISDYMGVLWSNPKRMYAASGNALRAIHGAAVENAGWQKGTMEIAGVKEKGSMKELKGKNAETIQRRVETIRFESIVDAIERNRLEPTDKGYLSKDAMEERLEAIGSHSRAVSQDDREVAVLYLDSRSRINAAQTMGRAEVAEILADAANMGESAAASITAVINKTNKFIDENNLNLFAIMERYKIKSEKVAEGRSKKLKDGRVENSEAGTAETKTTRDRVNEDLEKSGRTLTVKEDNTVEYGNRDGDPVIIKVKGASYEVVPKDVLALSSDGKVWLFGQEVGTWAKHGTESDPTGEVSVMVSVPGSEPVSANDLTSLIKRKGFNKQFAEKFESNVSKLTKAAPAADKLPEGTQIGISLSQTEKQNTAQKELLKPAGAATEMATQKIGAIEVNDATRVIAIKRDRDSYVFTPSEQQKTMTLQEFADAYNKGSLDGLSVGSVPAGIPNKAGKLRGLSSGEKMTSFIAVGRDTGTVNQEIVQKLAEKKEHAPQMLAAQRGTISMKEAGKIKVSEEQNLAELVMDFNRSTSALDWSKISTLDGLNTIINTMAKQAEMIQSLAPHGVKMDNASRRTSFFGIERNMAQFSAEERQAALDMFRRLDADRHGLPYVYEGKENQFGLGPNGKDVGSSRIYVGKAADPTTPKHFAVAHELGHWAFVNMLSPEEQLQFVRSLAKHYDADGKLNVESVKGSMKNAAAIEKATGKKFTGIGSSTNEVFAWQFTNWYADKAIGRAGEAAEQSLWQRVVTVGKNLLSHFMGQKIDPDLIPLFDKILPAKISDTKFTYGSVTDLSTGKMMSVADIEGDRRKVASSLTGIMEKVDGLRGKLAQHIFVPGSAGDAGMHADLEEAAKHMFGLLMGNGKDKDGQAVTGKSTTTGLRKKLNASRKGKTEDGAETSTTIPGAVDPRELFSRSSTGNLMTAIREMSPGGVADDIAYQATQGAEEFEVVVKDVIGANLAETSAMRTQLLVQEFKRLTGEDMSKISASEYTKYKDVLDKAEMFADHEVAKYAMETHGVDINKSIFNDDGSRVKLGTEQQRAVLGGMARRLYDLMGDSLDHLETKMERAGFAMTRSPRELTIKPTPMDAAVDKAAADLMAKRPKTPKKVKPATERSAAIIAKEEAERSVDGVQTGVPAGAPAEVKALVARVPHRDKEQEGIIGTLMSRLFKAMDLENPTNGSIYEMIGMRLELSDGIDEAAQASSTTPAFDELRKLMRLASENLTNPDKNPLGAFDTVVDVLSKAKRRENDAVNEAGIRHERIAEAAKKLARGERHDFDDDVADHVADIVADATDILSGLATTTRGKKAIGEEVAATPGKPVEMRYSDGSYHPSFAGTAVVSRIGQLSSKIGADLLESIGIAGSKDVAGDLGRNIAFAPAGKGTKTLMLTTDEVAASASTLEPIQNLNGEISRAVMAGDTDTAARLMTAREAIMKTHGVQSDGVVPVVVNMSKVFDPAMVTHAQVAALETLFAKYVPDKDVLANLGQMNNPATKMKYMKEMVAGEKGYNQMLQDAGFIGVRDGDTARMFSVKSAKALDAEIARLAKLKRNATAPDAPLVGEIFLNMALENAARPDPLAIEQRALQTGATEGVASLAAEMFKKSKSLFGLTPKAEAEVKAFHGLQLRSNPSRVRNAGGEWLAESIAPVEGTGFHESLATKTSTALMPLLEKLDNMTGITAWYAKSANQIKRNLDMRGHRIPQSDAEQRIVMAMRTNDISDLNMEERAYKAELDKHFAVLLKRQHDAGIPVGDIAQGGSYIPQVFNQDWIRANRDDAIDRLAKFFVSDGRDAKSANVAATKVINEAIFREDLQGILDGASSVYTQAFGDKLHSRKLNISGKEHWDYMEPLFNNNMRSLVTSYSEAANTRIEWVNRFGVRGHAVDTYLDIAKRGASGAIDALMGKASGMKQVAPKRADADISFDGAVRDTEFVSDLFSPIARDEREAGALTSMIVKVLEQGKDSASRAGVVDTLVKKYESEGGYGVNHFRKRAEAVVNGLADFGDEGNKVANHELDFMRKYVGTLEGRPAFTVASNMAARNFAAGVKAFNTTTLLGGSLLSSFADPAMSLIRSGSFGSWVKGTVNAVKAASDDPAYREALARIGVSFESIAHENIGSVNGGMSGRINNAFFHANLLTPWTNAQRQTAALVGFESIKANQTIVQREAFNGTTDSLAYRRSMRYLRQLGLGYLKDEDKVVDFASAVNGDMKIAEAIHKFTNESVFQPNRSDVPLWAQDPIAGMFFQFKSYPMMMGRLVKRAVHEAFATERGHVFDGGQSGKYAGDPASLMYLLTIGAAAGGAANYVKDVAFARDQEDETGDWRSYKERTASKMVQEFGFKEFQMENETMDLIVGTYVSGLLGIGAIGFLGDLMYQTAASVDDGAFGRERIMSQIGGPTVGTFMDSIHLIEGIRDGASSEEGFGSGSADQRNAVRKVLKRIPIPFMSQQQGLTENLVNDIAGESATKPTSPPSSFW
jgi:hypothetical protein